MENKTYICRGWKYNYDNCAYLSREGESFSEFKQRMRTILPFEEGWHHQFSEWKEIH